MKIGVIKGQRFLRILLLKFLQHLLRGNVPHDGLSEKRNSERCTLRIRICVILGEKWTANTYYLFWLYVITESSDDDFRGMLSSGEKPLS